MKLNRWGFIVCLLLIMIGAALGNNNIRSPLVTDRPDFTESAETVSPGLTQVEFGYTFSRMGDFNTHDVGEILIRQGLLERLELRLGINSYTWIRQNGASLSGRQDASAGFKIKLADAAATFTPGQPDFALLFSTTLPTGGKEFGTDKIQPQGTLAISYPITPQLSASSNLNYAYLYDGENYFDQLSGSLALGFGISSVVGSFLEFYAFSPESDNGKDTGFINGGFTFLLSRDFQLDARAGSGVNGRSPEFFLGAGAAVRF